MTSAVAHTRLRMPVRRPALVSLVAAVTTLTTVLALGLGSVTVSLAVFRGQHVGASTLGTKAIFPGKRITPAFTVGDASGGSEVDRSSSFGVSGDGLSTKSSDWATSFDSGRYLEWDFNHPLAGAIAVTAATFSFSYASSDAGTACFYLDVRHVSSGSVVATYGSPSSTLGCVTGTTPTTFALLIPATNSTDLTNDLRIRVYGKSSTAGAMVVDGATVGGTTAYQTFTLYPVIYRDAADGTPDTIPWALDQP